MGGKSMHLVAGISQNLRTNMDVESIESTWTCPNYIINMDVCTFCIDHTVHIVQYILYLVYYCTYCTTAHIVYIIHTVHNVRCILYLLYILYILYIQ